MIIGVSGKIGAGKDTYAAFVQKYHPTFQVKKYAEKLKRVAALLTGYEDQWTQEGKNHYLPEWEMTVGEFQQKLGTDAIRYGIRQDAWIIALFADYRPGDDWIITDVRFPNEAQAIIDRGGIVVRLNGTRITDSKRDLNHPSETSLDNFDQFVATFDNTHASIEQLENFAKMTVEWVHTIEDTLLECIINPALCA